MLIFMVGISIFLFVVICILINKLNDRTNYVSNKDIAEDTIKTSKNNDFSIAYLPAIGKYVARHKGKYLFRDVNGNWSYRDEPSHWEHCSTEEDAIKRYKQFLSESGKEIVILTPELK